jgi:hypothetical protein
VAPEWLDAATLSALGPAERRGLFLEGEASYAPEAFAEAEPEPSVDGEDGAELRAALAEIDARLTALEHQDKPLPSQDLQAILATLETLS